MEGTVKADISDLQQQFKRTAQPAFWPAALLRRTSVFAAGENLGAGAALPTPSIEITEGRSGPTARGTQKERHAYSVSFFLVDLIGFEPTTPTMRKGI